MIVFNRCDRASSWWGIKASSAKMPPSPLLSAFMMNSRYLKATTMKSDQKNSDRMPSTFSRTTGSEWAPAKHSFTA